MHWSVLYLWYIVWSFIHHRPLTRSSTSMSVVHSNFHTIERTVASMQRIEIYIGNNYIREAPSASLDRQKWEDAILDWATGCVKEQIGRLRAILGYVPQTWYIL